MKICDRICERGLIYISDYATLKKHNFFCEQDIELKFYYNDRKGYLLNFKDIG